ncbi:hypothetical protein [Sinorhizobium meliloti]|uniref:hypothetical protein n=1 Tax=Rhizobium meliloti TaxID=382 RepID=UPI0013E2CFEE|nr:hypothetical protein [Sinorhizobium meliloti]MDW9832105.1 hypothetical protein [Sinorhizobium meliloti]
MSYRLPCCWRGRKRANPGGLQRIAIEADEAEFLGALEGQAMRHDRFQRRLGGDDNKVTRLWAFHVS